MNNAPRPSQCSTAAVIVQSVLCLWLIGLSVFVALSHQAMNGLADQERVDSGLQQLEAQVVGLTETVQQRPATATAAELQHIRQALEARIAQVEQALGGHASNDDLQALRAEVEQAKARQATVRAAVPAQPRSPSKAAAKPEPFPLPLRIVGAELRAGQRSLSVAPATGEFTADQVHVLLPGDAVGPWRLQAIEGNTAVFQAGEQTRRLAIP